MKKTKDKIADLVRELCPKFDEVIGTSAVNRIAEFIEDLGTKVSDAEAFINDPHEGQTGILLEFFDKDRKEWRQCEILDGSPLYARIDYDRYWEARDIDLQIGLYANWSEAWGDCDGDDWDGRLGVVEPLPDGQDEHYARTGEAIHGNCEWYRLRRVALGPFSEKAKKWMRENIGYFKSVVDVRCGEV